MRVPPLLEALFVVFLGGCATDVALGSNTQCHCSVDAAEGNAAEGGAAGAGADASVVVMDGSKDVRRQDASALPSDAGAKDRAIIEAAVSGRTRDASEGLFTIGPAEVLPGSVGFGPGFIMTVTRVTAPVDAEVAFLATIGKDDGGTVRMALYVGSDGDAAVDHPTALIAETADMPVVAGLTRAPLLTQAPVRLAAGKSYWIALSFVADGQSTHLYQRAGSEGVAYRAPVAPFPDDLSDKGHLDHGPYFYFFLFARPL